MFNKRTILIYNYVCWFGFTVAYSNICFLRQNILKYHEYEVSDIIQLLVILALNFVIQLDHF